MVDALLHVHRHVAAIHLDADVHVQPAAERQPAQRVGGEGQAGRIVEVPAEQHGGEHEPAQTLHAVG
eukprot:CAMPEP_0195111012 /NCGR_PEP_ID=MMETSP0448-20130528/94653_1 /TAXON_ID=66468 /ORGANISM="Heterocapsa triquestra, Strain CCMP 448" /LENGTH=66 /DNA_ID=CAMNT_0040147757 /DNA_START=1 /DNA_END=197 /DNA_ORIENTATION=+